ncbi:Mbov_0396 family ICE element transmembrane protein [Mycoplasmopsis columbinasalis]|uniref:Uncharacterized protein n=1 Tax=Mycoplasmopsis columbinasalis TaxID=114880 RepID=A0A449BBG2_9BACT|nr:hypothetical protein [Mycoplasmopsis columbinasalis]VEU78383.1 Uncharacterised protein [Mycoplasmopsis columbinasalis]
MNSGDGVKTNISGYILIIGAAYAVIMSFIRLVEFIFHLVILFFVAPFSAAGSLLDDGLSIKKWNRKFWSKNIVIYSMLLSLIIFGFVVEMAVDFLNTLNLYWVVKIVFLALITIGSCFACLSFTSIVANLIGEEISVRKNVANLKAKAASFKVLKSPKATKTTKAKPGTKPVLQRNQKTLMKRNQAFKPQQLMQRGQANKTQSMRERLKQALAKANAAQQATKPNI